MGWFDWLKWFGKPRPQLPPAPLRYINFAIPHTPGALLDLSGSYPSYPNGFRKLVTTGPNGDLSVQVPGDATRINLQVDVRGYQAYLRVIDLPKDKTTFVIGKWPTSIPATWVELPGLVPDIPLLPALRVNGKWFETVDGQPWSQRACTDFRLFQRFLNGDNIDSILQQRKDLGFNQVRVLGMCELMFKLHPQDYPGYYFQLNVFCSKLRAFGLRIEFTIFADASLDSATLPSPYRRFEPIFPSLAAQVAHYDRVCEVLRGYAHMTFLEGVNEQDQLVNTIHTDAFTKPAGLISCHGSLGADLHPGVEPLWDYGTIHPSRPADWVRKAVHNPFEDIAEAFKKAATCNEMCRPNQGRGPIPSDHFEAGAGSALLHCGSTYHCEQGKQSELFTGDDLACAQAYVRGATAVPLSYRYGEYAAGHLANSPIKHQDDWASRTYARIVGNKACVVVCQKTQAWRLVLNAGWQVKRETDSVLELERP